MQKEKKHKIESTKFDDLEALADRVDELDGVEFMIPEREVHFDVRLKGVRNLVAVEENVLREVRKRAQSRKTSSESLINRWLREKLADSRGKRKAKAG